MKCSECIYDNLCHYRLSIDSLTFDHKGLTFGNLALLCSVENKKYEKLMEWKDSFADCCPFYKYKDKNDS